ncbi:MAG TPA: ABC transporter permease [Candidatus Corynebacterium gallistercoris]|uniref:ABC transporter permease n=1 Tax=Candidatus Corynebacterium gallistercoris TaxID=2838530 RepID=A0A9D1UQQ8_9CORY|nr:ABC transporter permease [Candidatus Corynebacterium gallistercoris]
MLQETWSMLTDPAAWSGPTGFAARIVEHVQLSLVALLIAVVIAVPLGLLIGHTGRGRALIVGTSGALRAIPSLGLLTALALVIPGGVANAVLPSVVVLVILAVPPILAGTYSGVDAITPAIRTSSTALGFSPAQVLWKVEVPLAVPQMMDGIRSALLQVISTATICAYLGTGGLGRYLIDGLATRDYPQVLAGAVVVIGLVLCFELALVLISRLVAPTTRSLR